MSLKENDIYNEQLKEWQDEQEEQQIRSQFKSKEIRDDVPIIEFMQEIDKYLFNQVNS